MLNLFHTTAVHQILVLKIHLLLFFHNHLQYYQSIPNDDEEDDGETEEADTGPDPEVAKIKFGELRTQYEVTRNSITSNGREHATTKAEIEKLSSGIWLSRWCTKVVFPEPEGAEKMMSLPATL